MAISAQRDALLDLFVGVFVSARSNKRVDGSLGAVTHDVMKVQRSRVGEAAMRAGQGGLKSIPRFPVSRSILRNRGLVFLFVLLVPGFVVRPVFSFFLFWVRVRQLHELLSPVNAVIQTPWFRWLKHSVSPANKTVGACWVFGRVGDRPDIAFAPRPPFADGDHSLLQSIPSMAGQHARSSQVDRVGPANGWRNDAKSDGFIGAVTNPVRAIGGEVGTVIRQAGFLQSVQHRPAFLG